MQNKESEGGIQAKYRKGIATSSESKHRFFSKTSVAVSSLSLFFFRRCYGSNHGNVNGTRACILTIQLGYIMLEVIQ